ncbi:MAG TPA: DUF2243 domain-containing protein [Solirubrobacterales bacterium]|nr:DUF2243 domain-containing protein [Solirubrobacterales bacterium]
MHRPAVLPGVIVGVGLGGFLDGIVLHQILQWHHMVSDEGCCPAGSLAGLEDNTLADGIFHMVTWVVTLVGSFALWRAWRDGKLSPPWRAQVGAMLMGWGIFNLIDSANHFILGLHHIRDDIGGPVGWDIGFLIFALGLIATGGLLMRATAGRAGGSGGA